MNPMLLRGLEQSNDIHYSLDPTMGYHRTLLFMDTVPPSNSSKVISVSSVYNLCLQQFTQWTSSCVSMIRSSQLVIRFHCGEALSFSHLLHCRSLPSAALPTLSQFSSTPIELYHSVPALFEVVDTSNISDSCGLLNVLLACYKLLNRDNGVLMTEMISTVQQGDVVRENIEHLLRMELSSFELLTGITIMNIDLSESCLLFMSNLVSLLDKEVTKRKKFICLEWKFLHSRTYALQVSENDMMRLLRRLYKALFKSTFFSFNLEENLKVAKDSLAFLAGQNEFASPTIQTFARLVAWAAENIEVSGMMNSDDIFLRFMIDISKDKEFLLQTNVMQEMSLFFTKFGLITVPTLSRVLNEILSESDLTECRRFLGSEISSPVVTLTLLVPRSAVSDSSGNSFKIFQISINDGFMTTDNVFQSIHVGYVKERMLYDDPRAFDKEAVSWIRLRSFAILPGDAVNFTFLALTLLVPITSVAFAPADRINVELRLNHICARLDPLAFQKYGPALKLFSAKLSDASHVSCEIETNFGSDALKSGRSVHSDALTAEVSAEGVITSISTTVSYNDQSDSFHTSDQPVVTPLSRPGSMRVTLGTKIVNMQFPEVCNTSAPLIQISRKSSYVKLTLRPFSYSRALLRNPFNMYYSEGTGLKLCGPSYVDLSVMPTVDLTAPTNRTEWLYTLAGAQLNEVERDNQKASSIISMRTSFCALLMHASGHSGNTSTRHRWFTLSRPNHGGGVIVLYINRLCIDLSLSSVVIDAAVCMLNKQNVQAVAPFFLEESGIIVNITEAEYSLWQSALPVMCERARTSWNHVSGSCEYMRSGQCEKLMQVCTCALGQGLQDTDFGRYARTHSHVYGQFFRAAISPLFPLYSERLLGAIAGVDISAKQPVENSIRGSGSGSSSTSSGIASSSNVSKKNVTEDISRCDNCGAQSAEGRELMQCGRCRLVKYCNAVCQKEHWKVHRNNCKK